MIFPPDTSRIVDRGFAFCTIYYENLNIAFVPAFMRGRTQMFPVEIKNARRMSQDRYTCEAVFSRVSLHKLLKGIVTYNNLRYATDAAHCGHFNAQLMAPLMKPKVWDEFVSEACDDPKYPPPLDLTPEILVSSRVGMSSSSVFTPTGVELEHNSGEESSPLEVSDNDED